MKLDIHYHTTHSDCSSLHINQVCEYVTRSKLPLFTVTDHGNARGCDDLTMSCIQSNIIYGVEVTTPEGDFLVYSLDRDYVSSLTVYQKSVGSLLRNEETAIVWAHPRVPHKYDIGWDSPNDENELISRIIQHIDGLEIFNGTMLSLAVKGAVQPAYFSNLMGISKRGNLCLTGGSDAQEIANFQTAWTEFPPDAKTPKDFIRALKTGAVKPGYDSEFYKIKVP
jgi:hypothetical protein